MTGLELLKKELADRGCTKSQIESKVVAVVLDVLANAGNAYEDLYSAEAARDAAIWEKDRAERRAMAIKEEVEDERAKLRREYEEAKQYIEAFNRSMLECETEDGRDSMRRAQAFVNSVDVETKYDNTAFIIALGAILSSGGIGPIEEYRKLNPNLGKRKVTVI